MDIRRIPHRPRHLTEPATAMDRITAAVAIHPPAMLATAIPLMAMLATAILLMATATALAIASPAGWRFIEPAGAEKRSRSHPEMWLVGWLLITSLAIQATPALPRHIADGELGCVANENPTPV